MAQRDRIKVGGKFLGPEGSSSELGGARSLLKNRPFCRLWVARFSAVAVIYALNLAAATLVEELTHSSAQTGLVILSSILPAFLSSLVAGAVVDRWGRVRVLVVSHIAQALVALLFCGGTHLFPPGPALAVVYAANAAGAAFTQFAISAEMALLPDLAGRASLMSANTLFQFSMLAAEGIGIVLLGPLVVKLAGAPAMGLLGAALCLLAVALVADLPRDQSLASQAEEWADWTVLRSDLEAGWRAIAQDRLLRLVAAQATLAATLLLVLLCLMPGLISRYLGLKVEDMPYVLLPGGLGFVLGAVLMNRWERRLSRPAWIATGLIGLGSNIGLLTALIGQGEMVGLLPFLVPVLCIGFTLALVIIPSRTVLQEHPPAEMRGRVIAAQLALANAAAVIPLLMGGALADQLGIRPVMGLLGLLAVGAGAAGLHQARN